MDYAIISYWVNEDELGNVWLYRNKDDGMAYIIETVESEVK